MEKEKKKLTKAKKVLIIINSIDLLFIIGLIVFLCIYFKDDIKLLADDEGKEVFMQKIEDAGVFGVLILLVTQILQVVVAFIPGEVVEFVAGAMYGAFFGMLICLLGLILATFIIYGLVKWLGKPFFDLNVNQKQSSKLQFLHDPDRSLLILFFIFLIPGIPKDIFIYFIPFTKIKLSKFILVSSIARIPSILSSTFVGAAVFDENYIVAMIVMGLIFIFSVLGLIFNKKIYEWLNTIKQKRKNKKEVQNHENH